MAISGIVLEQLLHNEQFSRKVIPFLKEEYFEDIEEQIAYKIIDGFISKYSSLPSKEAVYLELEKLDLNQKVFDDTKNLISSFKKQDFEIDWLVDQTEKFCQERAIYLALRESIIIADEKGKKRPVSAITDILTKALSVSFDTAIGHDYLEGFEERFEEYHRKDAKIPFNLKWLDKVTNGGIGLDTLNMLLAGLGVGKTLCMCSFAAEYMKQGYDVLYITLEMGEKGNPSISQRIDANLLDTNLDDLNLLPKDVFMKKAQKVRDKCPGKLVVKGYPGHSCSAATIIALLAELKLKKKFVPKVIFIDYLNLMASSTLKVGNNVNTYYYIKTISEEVRAIAQERFIPIWSATQANRDGLENSDLDVTNTGESIGLPQTVDFYLAVSQTEDMAALNQYLFKQLKSRYGDYLRNQRFVIGVHKAKMRLYDVEQNAQDDIAGPDRPVMDNSNFGERVNEEKRARKPRKKKLEGFS
jgi:replicative DNA helicase